MTAQSEVERLQAKTIAERIIDKFKPLRVEQRKRFIDLWDALTIGLPPGNHPTSEWAWDAIGQDNETWMNEMLGGGLLETLIAIQDMPSTRQAYISSKIYRALYQGGRR